MADATITRDRLRGHARAIQLAGAASVLMGVTSSWAQGPYDVRVLPYCAAYPPGAAPAIGPSNCTPVGPPLRGPTPHGPDFAAPRVPVPAGARPEPFAAARPLVVPGAMATSGVQSEQAGVATPKPGPPDVAGAARPPGLQAAITLRTPGAVTLAQIAALLAPASRRTVAFALSAADDYKKTDATHRVRLTWTGSLQALVEQLGAIYGLDVCVDDKAIRFTSRQRGLACGASAPPTS